MAQQKRMHTIDLMDALSEEIVTVDNPLYKAGGQPLKTDPSLFPFFTEPGKENSDMKGQSVLRAKPDDEIITSNPFFKRVFKFGSNTNTSNDSSLQHVDQHEEVEVRIKPRTPIHAFVTNASEDIDDTSLLGLNASKRPNNRPLTTNNDNLLNSPLFSSGTTSDDGNSEITMSNKRYSVYNPLMTSLQKPDRKSTSAFVSNLLNNKEDNNANSTTAFTTHNIINDNRPPDEEVDLLEDEDSKYSKTPMIYSPPGYNNSPQIKKISEKMGWFSNLFSARKTSKQQQEHTEQPYFEEEEVDIGTRKPQVNVD